MSNAPKKTNAEVETAALHCKANKEACRTLGIEEEDFAALCREYGIETPHEREERLTKQHLREGHRIRLGVLPGKESDA